jgi:hypothetical protein
MTPNAPDSNMPTDETARAASDGLATSNGHGAGHSAVSPVGVSAVDQSVPSLFSSVVPGPIAQANLFEPPRRVSPTAIVLGATAVMVVGLVFNLSWLGFIGAAIALVTSFRVLWLPFLRPFISELFSSQASCGADRSCGWLDCPGRDVKAHWGRSLV